MLTVGQALGLQLSTHFLIQCSERPHEKGDIEACWFEDKEIEAQRG